LFSESIENAPQAAAQALRVQGASESQVFLYATLPTIIPQLMSYSSYRWENNIRAAAILGVVGGGGLGQMFRTAAKVLRNRQYLAFSSLMWFGFGMLFAYISSSSFIVAQNLDLPPAAYAASFGINGIGIVSAGLITARLATIVRPRRLIRIGVIAQLTAFCALWVVLFTGTVSPWTVFPILFVLASSMGFIFGPATAMAMEHVRFASGTALALLGSIQFFAAAAAATLVTVVNTNALIALAEVGSVATLLVLGALIMGRAKPTRAETPTETPA
jgi:predicted MFS family arabinose efflux permease